MATLQSPTSDEVSALAAAWYTQWDAHAPAEEFRPLLDVDRVTIRHPGSDLTGWDGFLRWYTTATHTCFNETHTVKEVRILSASGDKTVARVVVNWQASRWRPPAARSERIVVDATHTWTLTRSAATGKPVLQSYSLDGVHYAEGSARL
jgi:hypothetical protein